MACAADGADDRHAGLSCLTLAQREQALARWQMLRVHLEDGCPLVRVAGEHGVPKRTLRRWLAAYRAGGLAALARRPRSDRGTRRMPPELRLLIEGLAACVGDTVIVRYDPRDMAEICVFTGAGFLCRAICPELAGTTVSLKDITAARNARRRGLARGLRERAGVVDRLLAAHQDQLSPGVPDTPVTTFGPASPLKLYRTE